jgi:hypothetical protein
MIFWAWKGRVVVLKNDIGTDKSHCSPGPDYQKFELVEVVDSCLGDDDLKIYVKRLNTGYCHYVFRKNCFPFWKAKKLLKTNRKV